MRIVPLIIALVVLLVSAIPSRAGEIDGHDAPEFEAALALWLQDDEEGALPTLASLAAGGNRAAQVLLARIDATPQTQGPWLVARSRAERIALLREPGGLSGRSWMLAAAEDTQLARLWRDRDGTTASAETALAFAGMGELRAARDTLQILANRQYRDFAAIADDPRYPPELRHLVWREWADDPSSRPRVDAEIKTLPPGDPQILRYEFREVAPADLDEWLSAAAVAAPLRTFCEATCPASGASCLRAGFALVDGHAGLAVAGSPTESLIAAERWNASLRGRLALLRQAPARFRIAEITAEQITAEDACVGAALATETARFPG